MGHAVRSCVLGMALAAEIKLPQAARSDLYYALLMKDAGCSTNSSLMYRILGTDDIRGKRDATITDWTRTSWESLEYALTHVMTGRPFLERVRGIFNLAVHQRQNAHQLNQIRCERGSAIALRMGLSNGTAEAIHSVNEHWNGKGEPAGLRKEEIPVMSRIMSIAQTADIFFSAYGPAEAIDVVTERSGRWFDPQLVKAFRAAATRPQLWEDVVQAPTKVLELEPVAHRFCADEETLDNICLAFADVIDAKSPFTYRHSTGVAGAAVAVARTLGLPEDEVKMLRRAALLHDVGKLGVSNAILDKPDKLTESEWAVVKQHPQHSYQILKRIPGFAGISEIAASHHEKLDGSGYFRGIAGDRMSVATRILVVSDVYDALAAKRPYRDALPLETVFGIMHKDAPNRLDASCLEALQCSCDTARTVTDDLLNLSLNVQQEQSVCAQVS